MRRKFLLTFALATSIAIPATAYLNAEPTNLKEAKQEVSSIEKKVEDSLWQRVKSYFSIDKILNSKFSLLYLLIVAFLIGVGTSFTPCIYPMIPITLGILQSQASKSLAQNFFISTAYVTGMATVYAILGYFAATTSLILGQWLSSPFVIALLILLFLYLAFSMFGFYEIFMPKFLQRGSKIKIGGTSVKGSILYSFLFGAISGTAASPCLTPALALLLGFVAKQGNPLVGFLTLFVFALGLGLLLIIIGTFSNTLTTLPRAGLWMNEIKKFFGFLLIGVSIYFLQPFLQEQIINILYLILAIATVGYYAVTIIKKILKKKSQQQNTPES